MNLQKLDFNDTNELTAFIINYKKENDIDIKTGMAESTNELIGNVISSEYSSGFKSVSNNKISGYIIMHIISFPMISGKELYISDLFICSKQRGKGIGRQMLQKAEELAKQNNCTRLMLNNNNESISYERLFYKKNGFKERTVFSNFVKKL